VNDIELALEELRSLGLHRSTRLISGPQGPQVLVDGRPVLLLCSNNYLGFADHPRVREAAADAAMRWGVGAGASRLVSGTMTIHATLEQRLAEFHGRESAVLFGAGYLANIGVISALARRDSIVFSDALNHASIVDGCRLARAETFVYEHCDLDHLAWGLEKAPLGCVIVTDSLFSMTGDVAPLGGIVELAARHGARVVVDEAHAIGTLGPGGRGAVAEAGLEDAVDVITGTLGKSLGSYGAYVCCSSEIVEYLVNVARPLIFSTAPPPPALAGALAALELLEEQPRRVAKLQANSALLRDALDGAGIKAPDGRTQLSPLVIGDAEATVAVSAATLARGVFVQAIRPPTVPAGGSLLRLTTMASHSANELTRAAETIAAAARDARVGFGSAKPAGSNKKKRKRSGDGGDATDSAVAHAA
jgi:glycine C-acetyltransferase/8-amino-7-oxononanoate synthase